MLTSSRKVFTLYLGLSEMWNAQCYQAFFAYRYVIERFFVFRADATTGSNRKWFKYLTDAKIQVNK